MRAPIRAICAAFLLLVIASACLPEVVWLPDSSGFVYTTSPAWPMGGTQVAGLQQGELRRFDIATKRSTLLAAIPSSTIRPALCPDGSRVAIARLTGVDTDASRKKGYSPPAHATLQVLVFDLQGKELAHTPELSWGEPPRASGGDPAQEFAQLYWAPKGNQLLVHANATTGIVDVGAGTAVMLGSNAPACYGTAPVRPDGEGFLLLGPRRKLVFCDWTGALVPIELPTEGLDPKGLDEALAFPAAMCWSRWEKDVAVATWKNCELRIDTGKQRATVKAVGAEVWSIDGHEIQGLHEFASSGTRIAVLWSGSSPRERRDAGLDELRVVVAARGAAPRTLVEKTRFCTLCPSPDGRLLALGYEAESQKKGDSKFQQRFLVVDQGGEIVARGDE